MVKVSGNNSALGTGLCDKSGDSTLPFTSVWRPAPRAGTWRQDLLYGMILAVVDCGAVLLAFGAAVFFRTFAVLGLGSNVLQPVPLEPYFDAPWLLLLWPAVFYYDGLYERGLGTWEEHVRISRGVFFGGLLATAVAFVIPTAADYSRMILVGTFLVAFFTVPFLRMYFKTRFLADLFPVRILLLTTEETDLEVQQRRSIFSKLGYRILQAVQITKDPEGSRLQELMHSLVRELDPDEILLSPPGLDEKALRKVLRCVESTGRPVGILSSLSIFQLSASIRNLDGIILFDLNHGLARPFSRFVKRAMDLVVASVLLVLLFPVFVLLAILIQRDSPGPVFYRHRRLDFQHRPFGCWKFRTMHRDADERLQQWIESGDERAKQFAVGFKLKDDPRITRIGKFLRKTSLDELPQLLNVLRGEMSLIGPRPVFVEMAMRYGDDYQYLTMAKGGMTGLWQVSGRNDLDYDERIALDLYYIRNWSLWSDVAILLRTVVILFTRTGAY